MSLSEPVENSSPSWFRFCITCKDGVNRNELVKKIDVQNIQTRTVFAGNLTLHPCFDQIQGTDVYRVIGDLSETDRIMNNTLWIGVYSGMTDAILDKMIEVIKASV